MYLKDIYFHLRFLIFTWNQRDVTLCVTLGKLHNLPMPQFFHVYNGDDNSAYFTGLLGRLNEIMHMKPLVITKQWQVLVLVCSGYHNKLPQSG